MPKLGRQRRSKRLPLYVSLRVYERAANNRPFRCVTETNAVSVHGALLTLNAKIKRGQAVLLVNAITEEERACRVVYVGSYVRFADHRPPTTCTDDLSPSFARPARISS